MSGRRTVERVCQLPVCGRVFRIEPSQLRGGRGKFCSVPCGNAAKVGRPHVCRRPDRRGEKNPAFKNWASRNRLAYVTKYRARYPEKAKAHDAVKSALVRGTLVRPIVCECCGVSCHAAAHHEDYSEPLVVVFACCSCHRKLDKARHERLAERDVLNNVDPIPVATVDLPVYDLARPSGAVDTVAR